MKSLTLSVNREAGFGVIRAGELKRFAIRGIALRSDFDAAKLRAAVRASENGAQTRRQIVRDWGVRFNAERPDGFVDRTSPGRTPILNAAQRAALVEQKAAMAGAVAGQSR